MSTSINSVVLIGRLTRDPDVHGRRCTLRLAVNHRKRVKGEDGAPDTWVDRPSFFDVVTFGGLAATCAAHLKRGRMVAVDGSLAWSEWQPSAEGAARRQKVEVIADQVRFLDAPRVPTADPGPEDAPAVGPEDPPAPLHATLEPAA